VFERVFVQSCRWTIRCQLWSWIYHLGKSSGHENQ
jgi:hypothetical protein